jgi:hypothetical protein
MHAQNWLSRWFFGSRPEAAAPVAEERADLDSIRREMAQAMQACTAKHRARAGEMIVRAASATELWFLRSELYLYLSQDLGQVEATVRINALKPLFRGWIPAATLSPSPHSGMSPLLQ